MYMEFHKVAINVGEDGFDIICPLCGKRLYGAVSGYAKTRFRRHMVRAHGLRPKVLFWEYI